MMEQGIEELFKETFSSFEADVDPTVWTNVQQAINTPASVPSVHGSNSGIAVKAAVVTGKLGVKAIVGIIAVVTGVSIATYIVWPTEVKKQITAAVKSPPPFTKANKQSEEININKNALKETNLSSEIINTSATQKQENNEAQVVSQVNVAPIPATVTTNAEAPPKDKNVENSATLKQPTQSKSTSAANATLSHDVIENTQTTSAEPDAAETHTYENDFADINIYLEPEGAFNKAALPNIFSPNGDGKNDEFKIKTKNLKSLEVTIFDISGKMIYQWNGIEGKWDGSLADGRPAPIGNYYYSLFAETIDGKRCIASSFLTLRR